MIVSIISWLVIGLIIGALARLIMPGPDPMGWFATALLGIAGSILGGLVGNLIWHRSVHGGFHPGFLLSLLGSILLLWIYRRSRRVA